MEDLEKFKMINLKEKVGRELEIHLGTSENVLVEYLISEARQCSKEEEFFSKMNSVDESFTLDLASSVFFLVQGILEVGVGLKGLEEGANGKHVEGGNAQEKQDEAEDSAAVGKEENLTVDQDKEKKEKKKMQNEEELNLEESGSVKKKKKSKKKSKKSKKKAKTSKKPLSSRSLKPGRIFKGKVKRILHFGAFVGFYSKRGYNEGLVHISNVTTFRIRDIREVIERYQRVFVKVLAINEGKISLSMKEIDQETGDDCIKIESKMRAKRLQSVFQQKVIDLGKGGFQRNGHGVLTGIKLDLDRKKPSNHAKDLRNGPDEWEQTRYFPYFLLIHIRADSNITLGNKTECWARGPTPRNCPKRSSRKRKSKSKSTSRSRSS